ncbi:FAD-dependent oxidoreductase [Nonomuraea sp. NPDC050643]|uniref:FAD-dependent oxidoreductase n=1 Tax=Nonomuraea sp. NPDC050643 TaxID=3155660 RepID=UPI0033DD6938
MRPTFSADVVVVGAGPTGLMLACELALAGVRCRVLERRTDQSNLTRAFAVHARTLELLDARGLAGGVLERGTPVRRLAPVPGATLDLGILAGRFPMLAIVPQSGTELVLRERAAELGVEIVPGAEVTALRQDDEGVTVETGDGRSERARYVVGCDGAHSSVRRLLGVDFVGKQYETHILLADVRLSRPPTDALFARTGVEGAVIAVPFGDGWFRAIAWDKRRDRVPLREPVTLAEMTDAFDRIAGDDFGMGPQRWSTRFLSERRQAARYRVGRVFLAGDAAHVHSPLGGQGMNTGIQDAINLGWKLAAEIRGTAPPWLLDGYEGERHPVGASVLRLTDLFNRLVLGRSRVRNALQALAIRAMLRFERRRRTMAERISGVGIAYPPRSRGEHAWAGRRMPDVDCDGGTRLYETLRDGRFVLVIGPKAALPDTALSGTALPGTALPGTALSGAARSTTLRVVRSADPSLPGAVLVRPDAYVAWAADGPVSAAQIEAAVATWSPAGERRPKAAPKR